jgi:CelD/BcsL family acetyltransferase involved in cellulose biosynthesis
MTMVDIDVNAYIKNAADLSAAEVEEWERLSREEPHNGSPFLSVHFAQAIAQSGVDARVCVMHDECGIAAFFPHLYSNLWNRTWKVAQRIGGELTDSFGLVARNDFRITNDELLRLAKINYLSFSHLDEAQLRYGLTAEQPRIGLRAKLDPSTVPTLMSVGSVTKHYLKDSEKRRRKIVDELGPLRFEFDTEVDRNNTLDMLIGQKRAQYQSTKVPDALKDGWKRETLHKLLNYKFDTCRGVLSTLYAGDTWVASHFGIMGNGILNLWFPVYNPECAKYSPGRLLLHHIVESCRDHGFDTLDRGEGDTPRKREIANEEYYLYRGVWKNGSALSHVLHGLDRVRWRLGISA